MEKKFKDPKRCRLLLATFDLVHTTPGDRRYREADEALAMHGLVYRPIKQLRLLITSSTCRVVKFSLEQRLGRSASILVAPITSIPAWRVHGAEKRREWRNFVHALDVNEVEVKFVTSDRESGI